MQMEEQILAEGCRKGDDMARKELYDRYAGRLLSICMRYAGDRATAEDLLHDAFLKIYGRSTVSPTGEPARCAPGSSGSRSTWRWSGYAAAASWEA